MATKDEITRVETAMAVNDNELHQIPTIEIDNYNGLTLKASLVYTSLLFVSICQLWTVVGSGAFSRDIATSFNRPTDAVWMSQTLVITVIVLGPFISQGADLWGRKWFLCGLTGLGAVGSVITGRADSMEMAIGGQVITALSLGNQTLLYAIASEILPRRFRPGAQAGITGSGGLGAILALLAGSYVVKEYTEGWRIVFYIAAALLGVSAITCVIFYNPPPRALQQTLSQKEKLGRIDWPAFGLLAIGVTLLSIGLSWGQNPYPWKSARVLGPLVVGIVFLLAFAVHQTVLKKNGIIHHTLFKQDRNFALALGCIFADGMIFWAGNNYYPFQASVLYETDPVRVGLMFAIAFITAIFASVACAIYSSSFKDVRGPLVASFASFCIFNVLMATIKTGQVAIAWAYPIFLGIGLGFSLTSLVTIAQLSTPPNLVAVATGLIIAARSLGGSIGLGIFTAILNSAIAGKLPAKIAAAVVPLGLNPQALPLFIGALAAHNDAALFAVPGVSPQIIGAGVQALQQAYLESFRGVWIAAAVVSFVTMIGTSLLISQELLLTLS